MCLKHQSQYHKMMKALKGHCVTHTHSVLHNALLRHLLHHFVILFKHIHVLLYCIDISLHYLINNASNL